MTLDDEDLRLRVYRTLAATGRAPSHEELALSLDASVWESGAGLRRLHRSRHLVLGPDDDLLMAHPFSTVPLGFSVMGEHVLWWDGCAWDAFALPHLVDAEPEVLVATRCPGCGAALSWVVGREAPPAGPEVAHFLVPAARVWDDVVHTCGHQRLFCAKGCVTAWLARTGNERGAVLDLSTLWRLAQRWYAGRLDRGYVRREPEAAADHFRRVGLSGPFWGLPDGTSDESSIS